MGNYWTSTETPEDPAESRLRALEARIKDLEGRLVDTPYSRPPTPRPPRMTNLRPSFPSWHGELMQKLNDRREKIEDL